jgi:hypothetical protein
LSENPKSSTLSERIEARAKTLHSDKRPPVMFQIIEAHEKLATLHLEKRSWANLVEILDAEGVHLSQGTLRNYMARIGKAKAALAAIIHEAPVLARGAMFEGPLLLDAHR